MANLPVTNLGLDYSAETERIKEFLEKCKAPSRRRTDVDPFDDEGLGDENIFDGMDLDGTGLKYKDQLVSEKAQGVCRPGVEADSFVPSDTASDRQSRAVVALHRPRRYRVCESPSAQSNKVLMGPQT